MNVLVTGGAGYLGSLAAASLLAAGHRVRVLDSLQYGGEALLGLYRFDAFDFMRGDLRSPDDLERSLDGMDAVVHLAAIVGDPACARAPELAREVNLDASLALFKASRRHAVTRFVFASTCSNYGRMGDPEELVSEESQLLPLSLYAETKVGVELELLRSANGTAPSVTVLRFATLYGISPRMRLDLTVNEFAAELARARRLEVYGEQFWRPYLHVRDAADLVRRVLEAPPELVSGEVFNAGDTRENYRKADLVDMIREQLGDGVTIEYVAIEDDPRDYRVTFEKLERTLDFHATRTVRDGIREVLAAVAHGVVGDLDDPRFRN
jgi:nucleoside-diphosphate-sugar epimerase